MKRRLHIPHVGSLKYFQYTLTSLLSIKLFVPLVFHLTKDTQAKWRNVATDQARLIGSHPF